MPRYLGLYRSTVLLLMCMYRGVVQLFNAVHKQQSLLEGKLAEAGPSVRQREKAMQSLTKGRFLDMLKNVKVCIYRIYLHILLLKWFYSISLCWIMWPLYSVYYTHHHQILLTLLYSHSKLVKKCWLHSGIYSRTVC